MKTLLLILTLLTGTVYSQNKFYIETSGGRSTTINYEDEVVDPVDMSVTYENNKKTLATVSFGTYFNMGDYSLVDVQIGLSYPYVITGKIGVGSYFGKKENIAFIAGIRPYPLTAYAQLNIRPNTKVHFVISGELGTGADVSLGTTNILNAGLRVPINR